MALQVKENEVQVLFDKTLSIKDFESDTLTLHILYNSTQRPEFAAKLLIDLQDTSEDGTWITADELDAMSQLFAEAAKALRVANKPIPKGRRFK